MFRWLDDFQRANLVRTAFGDPRQQDRRTVIPVASVSVRVDMPVGLEARVGGLPALEDAASARPLALISVVEDGVRVAPVGAHPLGWALGATAVAAGILAGWRLGRFWRT